MSKKEKIFPINTFGGRIQYRRTQVYHLSRSDFYDLVHPNDKISRESKNRTIKNWESGQNDPDLTTLQKICAVLECSADYLLGSGADSPSAKTVSPAGTVPSAGIVSPANAKKALSEDMLHQLQQLALQDQSGTKMRVLDDLLRNSQFTQSLTDKIYDYFVKYAAYMDGEALYSRERQELDKLTEGDVLKEIALLKSGSFTQTMSKRKVAELKDIAEAARYKIQREMDSLSEDLAEAFYRQKTSEARQLFHS